MNILNIMNLTVSGALFGLIWLVQLVQYPGFIFFDEKYFSKAMRHHQNQISLVVAPLMIIEFCICSYSVWKDSTIVNLSALSIVFLIWVLTFTVQVPLHQRLLEEGFSEERIRRLTYTNWSRTTLWTIKLALIIFSIY